MRSSIVVLSVLALLTGCREADGPADPSVTDARVYLTSSPNGAEISVDGRNTGQFTPDTVALRRGDRAVVLRLDSAGYVYEYGAIIQVPRTDSVIDVSLPLGLQCSSEVCFFEAQRGYDAAGLWFVGSAAGTLLFRTGNAAGLLWPGPGGNGYAASGMPLLGGLADDVQVALGMYDQSMLVGLPAPHFTLADGAFRLTQQAWILPPPRSLVRPTTVRGIHIDEEITAHDDVNGVIIVRLTYRNISADPLVHLFAPHIPDAPVTYTNAWIGFAMDPDIGRAQNDAMSYDPDLDMVFAYDLNFFEEEFIGEGASAPGLVGMRVLEAPAGTSVLLNAWPGGSDWAAGTPSEEAGYGMLTGSDVFSPDHPHPQIGHIPSSGRDIRMSVTAGPLTIAPGAEVQIVIAIAVAPPSTGTFTSGMDLEPGDPLDASRPLYDVAGELRARMIAAEALAGS